MSFNGSGTFVLNSGGLPYVTGTTISSTHANNLNSDLATGLSTCITKNGQTTITANLPMSTFRHTNVGAATARTDYARASQVQDSTLELIGSVAGTNTITGSLSPAITAYAAGQKYLFVPANTNTGATTININSVGAANVFWNGAACVGGEIRQNIPCVISYDGTQFQIVGNGFNAPFLDTHAVVEGSADSTKKVRIEVDGLTTATTRVYHAPDQDGGLAPFLGALQSTTSGTTFSYTVPSWVKRITFYLNVVSLDGTDNLLFQIGDSGGLENTGYLSTSVIHTASGSHSANTTSTSGYVFILNSAAASLTGKVVFENILSNAWLATGMGFYPGSSDNTVTCTGLKTLSGALDRISLMATGSNNFDAGQINVLFE